MKNNINFHWDFGEKSEIQIYEESELEMAAVAEASCQSIFKKAANAMANLTMRV
jgi:hypothetical protein